MKSCGEAGLQLNVVFNAALEGCELHVPAPLTAE